ncbi:heterokaryon incompatibility protein, partial [Metarhizium majus ARSEF 297]
MDLFRQGIPIHGLPQTFQDVVIAVRAFGIRYVWIDALCIIQDSPEDWEREGAMMRDVYTNSACTIAATASESPDQGLFRCRDPATILPKRITAPSVGPRPNNDVEYLLFDRSFLERRIFDGPLHMRGWVFQERMLSPRVLHFTKDQLVWECFTETKCETFPKGMPLQIHTKELGPRQSGNQMANTIEGGTQASATSSSHSLQSSTECNLTDWRTLSTWRELVKQYSKCDLTYTTDKLPALAGLAKAYQDTTGDAYLAGLWRSFLLDQLDWRVYTPGGRVSSQYRAPSWSWASVDSPVRPFMLNPRSLFLPVINNIQVKTRGPEYFGRTLTAYLDLEGYLIHASIHSLDDERIACQLQVGKHIVSGQLLRDTADTDFILGSAIICLPLKIDAMAPDMYPLKDLVLFCMVLEPIHGTKSVEYQRVALLIVSAEGQQLEPFRSFGISINQDSTFEVTEDYSIIRIV